MKADSGEYSQIKNLCDLSSRYHLLTKERERELLTQFHSEDPKETEQAIKLLVLHNLRLVIKKAGEFSGKGIPIEDLCQEGITGVIRAVEKFDLSREVKFSTYAYLWIEQRIRRCIENKSRLVKIPLNVLAKMTALKKIYKKLQEDFNRPPVAEEIAAMLGISVEEASELGRWDWLSVSLDDPGEEEGGTLSMLSYIVDGHEDAHKQLERKEDKEYLHSLLGILSTNDMAFAKMRWGLVDNKERTHKEMATLLKIPLKEVKERDEKILAILRDAIDFQEVNVDLH